MATAAAKKTTATKTKAKAAPKPAPEVVEEATTEEVAFGVADVAELIKIETGEEVKTRDLRTLLRKMARDGRLTREIVAGNRARWEFDGPEDPSVLKIIDAYKEGELEADKKEKLEALKARKAEQRAAKAAAAEKETPEVDDSDEELEED